MAYEEVGGFLILSWGNNSDNPRDAKALKYISDVKKELARISSSKAGRALLQSITAFKKRVTIMPSPEKVCNAAEEQSGADGTLVLFSPDDLSQCSEQMDADDRSATLPHEILHHELFHALRRISGKNHPVRLSGLGNTEEFLAILVTNIFISDVTNKHKTSLRVAWSSHHQLGAQYAESFAFFSYDTRIYNVISWLCDENRDYVRLLSHVHARFNPVAAFIKDRRKAFEVSAEAMDESAWMGLWVSHVMKEMKPLQPAKKP